MTFEGELLIFFEVSIFRVFTEVMENQKVGNTDCAVLFLVLEIMRKKSRQPQSLVKFRIHRKVDQQKYRGAYRSHRITAKVTDKF